MKKLQKNHFEKWARCLFLFLSQARREGLLALEFHICNPKNSDIFNFAQVLDKDNQIPTEFTTTIMELYLNGFDLPTVDRGIEKYLKNISEHEIISPIVQEGSILPLLNFIWETLRAGFNGNSPIYSLSLGRLSIPVGYGFSKLDMDEILKDCRANFARFFPVQINSLNDIDKEIDDFIKSIS